MLLILSYSPLYRFLIGLTSSIEQTYYKIKMELKQNRTILETAGKNLFIIEVENAVRILQGCFVLVSTKNESR